MKYTQEQLDGMSELEKNVAVAEKLGLKCRAICESISNAVEIDEHGTTFRPINYCNIPNHIMPIVFEYEVSLFSPDCPDDKWMAFSGAGSHCQEEDVKATSTNPLIAIVDCFLMMDEES